MLSRFQNRFISEVKLGLEKLYRAAGTDPDNWRYSVDHLTERLLESGHGVPRIITALRQLELTEKRPPPLAIILNQIKTNKKSEPRQRPGPQVKNPVPSAVVSAFFGEALKWAESNRAKSQQQWANGKTEFVFGQQTKKIEMESEARTENWLSTAYAKGQGDVSNLEKKVFDF